MIVLGAVLCPLFASAQHNSTTTAREQLRKILVEARDAEIQNAANDSASFNGWISNDVHQMVEYFLYLHDKQDALYLQQHLKTPYAEEIAHVLEPQPTLEEPLAHAKSSDERMKALAEIACDEYTSGTKPKADHNLDLAIKAGLEPADRLDRFSEFPEQKLLQLTGALEQKGCSDGVQTVLIRLRDFLQTSDATGLDWRELSERAIETGNLKLAQEALEHVGSDEGESEVKEELESASTTELDPGDALRVAVTFNNVELRIRTLCAIARRQSSSGNSQAALETLQLAVDTARSEEDDTDQVFELNDIAWAQIDIGDMNGAEQTLTIAMQSNEKHRWGADQVNGWVSLADSYAFLGHFDKARKIALKSDDSFFRGEGLHCAAYRETAAGKGTDAMVWAEAIHDPEEHGAALLGIAKAMIEDLQSNAER